MASRTQMICLHEGKKGRSTDPVFINALIRALTPKWIRKEGSNWITLVPCGGRKNLISSMPAELRKCLGRGADTTLMVWADLDHDMQDGDQLKNEFWNTAKNAGIKQEEFKQVVFAFAKDRIENWIEFLNTGNTDENKEGARIKNNKEVAVAARALAEICKGTGQSVKLPDSLAWSCTNWRVLADRMNS